MSTLASAKTGRAASWLRLLLLGLGLLGLGVAPGEARAEDLEGARQHFDRGVVLYRQGRFEAALAEFERSQRLRPSPGLHYNLGQAQRALRRHGQAYASFQRYLAETADLPAGRKALVRQILDEIRPHLAWLTVTHLPSGATVRVDGRKVEARPDGPLALDAGSHVVEISGGGASRTEEVVAAPGQSLTVRGSLAGPAAVLPRAGPGAAPSGPGGPEVATGAPAAVAVVTVPAAAATGAPRPFYRRWWFWTAVGVVVVGAVVAGAAAGASQGPSGTLSPGTHQFR